MSDIVYKLDLYCTNMGLENFKNLYAQQGHPFHGVTYVRYVLHT